MTYLSITERLLVKRALTVAASLAIDELEDQEVESMYRYNVELIAAALQAVADPNTSDSLSEEFSLFELGQLSKLRDGVLTIRSRVIELSDAEVTALQSRQSELLAERDRIYTEISEISRRLVDSGESKLRRIRARCAGHTSDCEPDQGPDGCVDHL